MKSQTIAITIAVLALPIYAQDQPRPNTTTTTLSVPISQQPADSPLVRAAKATGRLGKKPGFIITNDTLLRVGSGRLAISTSQGAALPAAPLPKDPTAAPLRPQADAKTKADAATARQRLGQANSDYNGENVEARHDDPAQQERQMQQATTPKPPEN
ncbi:MAG: hypothetical protein M3041_14635 [Acidobacteriota bacterium]|nr:hypothetical protein [Acidobacteriota bacterium]